MLELDAAPHQKTDPRKYGGFWVWGALFGAVNLVRNLFLLINLKRSLSLSVSLSLSLSLSSLCIYIYIYIGIGVGTGIGRTTAETRMTSSGSERMCSQAFDGFVPDMRIYLGDIES